eukprot:m.285505 g.285505  ORF g.285505 m.285505 type:complete len:351 (-) comp16205_c0_seq8:1504-2556(-)
MMRSVSLGASAGGLSELKLATEASARESSCWIVRRASVKQPLPFWCVLGSLGNLREAMLVACVRKFSENYLHCNHTQGINVHRLAVPPSESDLRGTIGRSTTLCPSGDARHDVVHPGVSEIAQLDLTIAPDQHVLRLHIAMHHAATVDIVQSSCHPKNVREKLRPARKMDSLVESSHREFHEDVQWQDVPKNVLVRNTNETNDVGVSFEPTQRDDFFHRVICRAPPRRSVSFESIRVGRFGKAQDFSSHVPPSKLSGKDSAVRATVNPPTAFELRRGIVVRHRPRHSGQVNVVIDDFSLGHGRWNGCNLADDYGHRSLANLEACLPQSLWPLERRCLHVEPRLWRQSTGR